VPNKSTLFLCIYPSRGGNPCDKPGIGFPPLCSRHERYRDELDDEEDPIGHILGVLFQRPEVQRVLDQLNDVIDKAAVYIDQPERFRQLVDEEPFTRGRAKKPPPRHKAPTPASAKEDPRVVLGFAPTMKLTSEIIKTRKKELARLWHPDHGGSEEAMKRLNTAADVLLRGF